MIFHFSFLFEPSQGFKSLELRHNRQIRTRFTKNSLLFYPKEAFMTQFTILLEPATALFYSRIATACEKPVEQVLSDALFKLAGELSLEALQTQ